EDLLMRHATFKVLIISLIFSLATFSALAQVGGHSSTEPIEIRGQVRYAVGLGPVANVLVRLESLNGGYVGEERTDNLGKFRFSGLLPMQYLVYIRHPGYRDIQREVNLVMIPSDYIQLQLVPDNPIASGVP